MIRTFFQLFRNTKQCFLIYVLFSFLSAISIIISGLLTFVIKKYDMDVVGVMTGTLAETLLAFIIFMYITYEFISLDRRCHAEECLSVLPVSKNSQEGQQILLCFLLNGIYVCVMLLINIIFAVLLQSIYPKFLIFTAKVLLVYLFLPGCIAILIGAILSHIQNGFIEYGLLVLIAFYVTIRDNQLFYLREKLFGVSDFTQFFNVGNVNQYGYLLPIDAHFVVKPIYIIGFLLLILLGFLYRRTRMRKYIVMQILCVCIITVCVMIWKQPCGGYYFGYEDMEEALYDDVDRDNEKSSKKNDFYIEKYDMKLDLSKEMYFKVIMTLSDYSCSEYDFTFCNLYSIQSVRDGEGEALEYYRDRNTLSIKNEDCDLKEIIIEYTGISLNRYFAGKNGIYLPGNYPFYPIAGKRPVLYHGLCELPSKESWFHVKVDYKERIFSNLEQVANGEYEGISNNFTMVSGFWEEKEIDGFRMVYPYVSINYNPDKNTYLLNAIREYSDYKSKKPINGQIYQMDGKTIIIAPFGYEGGNYMFASDTVLVGCKWDLDNIYKKYLMTGEWYQLNEVTDDDIQQVLEDNSK